MIDQLTSEKRDQIRLSATNRFYRNISPQVLARSIQLWSARGLDFDQYWRVGLKDLPGFRPFPDTLESTVDSAQPDLVFLFDQCVLFTKALRAAAILGHRQNVPGLTPEQWKGLASISARLVEQLAALRLLSLSQLPTPAMQIARSISEDADMALVLLIRRKLAERFTNCRTPEEANTFWRRHIAGGRAFRTISEKLYTVGIDYSTDTSYAEWRKDVLTTLGAAVHSNSFMSGATSDGHFHRLLSGDSLFFAAFRIHELCAYSQLVRPELPDILQQAGQIDVSELEEDLTLAPIAGHLSAIIVNQLDGLTQLGNWAPEGGVHRD